MTGGGGVSLWKFDIIKAVKLVEDHWGLFLYTSLWFNQNNYLSTQLSKQAG